MPDHVVVNASPLIVLARARRTDLLTLAGTPTLGLALPAKEGGVIPLARPLIEDFLRAGLYLSESIIDRALKLVGE